MKILWVPGWASDFQVWEKEIAQLLPSHQHFYVSFQDLYTYRDHLGEYLLTYNADALVAWSMGTQLYFQHSALLSALKKVVLMAPFFDFCHPEYGWNRKVLMRMIRQLEKDAPMVINNFSIAMGKTDPYTRTAWLDKAKTFSLPALEWGLNYLKEPLDPSQIKIAAEKVHVLGGEKDVIVPPNMNNILLDIFKFASHENLPDATHWPLSAPFQASLKYLLYDG